MARIASPEPHEMDYLDPPLTPAQRRVSDFFVRYLPDGWEVHVRPYLNGLEPHFVVMNPDVGIGVYRVEEDPGFRDGSYFSEHSKLWRRSGRGEAVCSDERNPVKLVRGYKQAVMNVYCAGLQQSAGFGVIAAGVIFPDILRADALKLCRGLRTPSEDKYCDSYPVAGSDNLNAGNAAIVLPLLGKRTNYAFGKDAAASFRDWLREPDSSRSGFEHVGLDDSQRRASDSRTATGYRRIRGPAGSGKTEVVARRAALLAMDGKRVLVSCYNLTMMNYLRHAVSRWLRQECGINERLRFEADRRIEIRNFHGWAQDHYGLWSKRRGDLCRGCDLTHANCEVKPGLEAGGVPGYDAVLVDEGQDFALCWWRLLSSAVTDSGERLLVADKTQNIYGRSDLWTTPTMLGFGFRGPWTELDRGYRLPSAVLPVVSDYADRFLVKEDVTLPAPGLFDGHCRLRWVQRDPGAERTPAVCADEMIGQFRACGESFSVGSLAVLAQTHEMGRMLVEEFRSREWSNILELFEVSGDRGESRRKKLRMTPDGPGAKAATIHSYKGWEARHLVLWFRSFGTADSRAVDLELSAAEQRSLFYVALTRLKDDLNGCSLTVVCEEPALREFGQRWFDDFCEI